MNKEGILKRILSITIIIMSVAICLYHFYTSGFGAPTALKHRIIHWGFFACLAMLLNIQKKDSNSFLDSLLKSIDFLAGIGSISIMVYMLSTYERRIANTGILTSFDIIVGALFIFIVLWTTYRRIGWSITLVAIVALAYVVFGHHIPGVLGHRMYSVNRIVSLLAYTTDGIQGSPLGASSTFVILFIMLAAFLDVTGAGDFFINMAVAGVGRYRGGPAKTAVLASAMFGTISGSVVANVVSTGSFTIPLMKKYGFEPDVAAATEAVSSTGGQIMPPVMGATAFIIAEVTGIPYVEVMKAAIVPAVLFYATLFFVIDAYSSKRRLLGLPKEALPNVKDEMIRCGHMMLPLVILIVVLFMGYTALKAGFYSLLATIIFSFVRKNTRIGLSSSKTAFCNAARQCVEVACATSCAGIIVGSMFLSGLGTKLASLILLLSGGKLIITLLLTSMSCIVLGMGMPTVASYLILSIMIVPALIELGVPIIVAHLFIFYFGINSTITPPVAMAAYAGAGIAGADTFKTGWTALRMGMAGFIIPYMFVYNNELVLMGSFWSIVLALCSALLGVLLMASAIQGWLLERSVTLPQRVILFVAALLLIKSGIITDILGLVLGAVVIFKFGRKSKTPPLTI